MKSSLPEIHLILMHFKLFPRKSCFLYYIQKSIYLSQKAGLLHRRNKSRCWTEPWNFRRAMTYEPAMQSKRHSQVWCYPEEHEEL